MPYLQMQYVWTEQEKQTLEMQGWKCTPSRVLVNGEKFWIATRGARTES